MIPNNIWIGTNKGLDRLNLATRVFTHFNQDLKNNPNVRTYTVYDIEFDDKKDLWLGTSGGLDFMDRKTGKIKRYLPNVSIWCIMVDVNNDVWTTSSTGLYLLDKKSDRFTEFLNPKTNERFFDIIDILEDDKHFMWVRATNEILRISPDHQEVRVYSGKKGARECNPAFDRYNITDSKGNVYMVADEGFHVFHPDSLFERPNILPIVLYELKVNNRVIYAKARGILQVPVFRVTDLKLNFSENDFSLKFLSFDYTEDEKINYYAKLEGYDKDWRYLGSYNSIDYYNVPPGHYTFHTRAINSEGYSSEKVDPGSHKGSLVANLVGLCLIPVGFCGRDQLLYHLQVPPFTERKYRARKKGLPAYFPAQRIATRSKSHASTSLSNQKKWLPSVNSLPALPMKYKTR